MTTGESSGSKVFVLMLILTIYNFYDMFNFVVIIGYLFVIVCRSMCDTVVGQHIWQLLIQCSQKNIRLVLAKLRLHGSWAMEAK